MKFIIILLAIFIYYNYIIEDTTCQKVKDQRPFYPDPMFSIIEPNMAKHHTAHYGDYRYFDVNYEYTINIDFYRYGVTEAPDYSINPSSLTVFHFTKKSLARYWAHYKFYYRISFANISGADSYHYNIFKKNLKNLLNLGKENPTANFRINQFTHLTHAQFIGNYTGFDSGEEPEDDYAQVDSYEVDIESFPRQLDWSVYNNATTLAPKDQGPCMISYVYSAIHNLELKLLIDASTTSADDMKYMSIQQGFDCSEPKRECLSIGGKPHFVFRGLMNSTGVQLLKQEFEDEMWFNLTCQWHDDEETVNSTLRVAGIEDWGVISVNDELELVLAVNEYGPISTAIYVSNEIKNYHSGIATDKGCGRNTPNHAVLITGYGVSDDDIPYWIIKNSWGSKWGENGFLFLIRNKAACGIGQYLAYAYVRSLTTTTTTTTPKTATTPSTICDERITECDL